jgi:outer membrane murein-binding lipoprotein Lpp
MQRRQPRQPPQPDVIGPTGAAPGTIEVPRTRGEYDALVARREELKGQRRELAAQRSDLLGQRVMANTDVSKQALDQRMQELDVRQLRLDQEINALDDAIGAARGIPAPADPFTMFRQFQTIPSRRNDTGNLVAQVALGEALVFVLVGVLLWHTLWKRSLAKMRTMFAGGDSSARLDQLQRAVDVIAVEVERISENQRYVTKMLNERVLGAGDAQPLATKRKIAEPARASDEG